MEEREIVLTDQQPPFGNLDFINRQWGRDSYGDEDL